MGFISELLTRSAVAWCQRVGVGNFIEGEVLMLTGTGDMTGFTFNTKLPTGARDADGRPVSLGEVAIGVPRSSDEEAVRIVGRDVDAQGVGTISCEVGSANEDGTTRVTGITVPVLDATSGDVVGEKVYAVGIKSGRIASFDGEAADFSGSGLTDEG